MYSRKVFSFNVIASVLLFTGQGFSHQCSAHEAEATDSSVMSHASKKKLNKDTAEAVNQIPGVKIKPADLETPVLPPIKGFHPIKKLLRPVENLENMSISLEQQIMKLGGPIAALHPPMQSLDNKMSTVKTQLAGMSVLLDGMLSQVTGVRSDLAALRKEIAELKAPLIVLQKPLAGVSSPLADLSNQLNYVLYAIAAAGFGIVFGTPFAAILIYRNRKNMLPKEDADAVQAAAESSEPEAVDSSAEASSADLKESAEPGAIGHG